MPDPYSQPSAGPAPRSPRADPTEAARLRRPSWRDPRLLAGVLIVALSVSGVIALLTAQNRTVEIYAADRLLTVGDRFTVEDLRVVDVQIDALEGSYFAAADEIDDNAQFIAMVDEGELVPRRAVARVDPLDRQAVTVDVEHALARGVDPGRLVDVWAAEAATPGSQEEVEVERIAAGAQVSAITEASGTFGAQNAVTIELLVDPEELPALLVATSSSAAVSVVPAGDQ
jgi:hypothetical protein